MQSQRPRGGTRPRCRPSGSSNSSTEAERRARREAFIEELLSTIAIYPLTTDIARLAGKLDAEQQKRGVVIPFADLLIGATALFPGTLC
jgi:predicted nucleic acid-binding protein